MMDLTLFYAGIGAAGVIIATTSGLVWLIITLITRPIKEDIEEIKCNIEKYLPKIMSETELNRMISLSLSEHARECGDVVDKKISAAMDVHEKLKHGD